MPTGSGKLQLQDYDAALTVRGFDGFQPGERTQMINFGYRDIARKFPFTWEQTSQTYTLNPGSAILLTQSGSPLTPDNINSVFCTTDPNRRKLEPEEPHRFLEKWLYLDLTSAANQGMPTRYYLFEGNLYILPPPQTSMTFSVHFYQYLADLVNPSDAPATPQIFDEVILDAALVRCHRRAHELQLAAEAQARVDDAVFAMLQDDVFQMEELQERVLPDNTWL